MHRSTRRGRRLAVATLAALLTGATPAMAQHADPRPPGWVDVPTEQAVAKSELAEAWVTAVSTQPVTGPPGLRSVAGTGAAAPAAVYEELAETYEATYGELPAAPSPSRRVGGVGLTSTGPPSYVPPSSKTLSVGSVGQQTGYYCGPASGFNILGYKGLTKSKATKATLTQKALANSSHMRTDANKLTSVWGNNYNRGLNQWRSGKDTGFYVRRMLDGTSDRSYFSAAFLYDLNANEPFAVSTGEAYGASKPRYNGHSSPRSKDGRGHWITAYGYSGYSTSGGGTTKMSGKFADPMWALESNVKKTFSHNLNTFYASFVSGRGIVW